MKQYRFICTRSKYTLKPNVFVLENYKYNMRNALVKKHLKYLPSVASQHINISWKLSVVCIFCKF